MCSSNRPGGAISARRNQKHSINCRNGAAGKTTVYIGLDPPEIRKKQEPRSAEGTGHQYTIAPSARLQEIRARSGSQSLTARQGGRILRVPIPPCRLRYRL